MLQPSICSHCGQTEWLAYPVKIDLKQVAQLVDRPIEVVEYHRHHCQCRNCGQVTERRLVVKDDTRTGFRGKVTSLSGMGTEIMDISPMKNNKNCYGS